MVIASDGVWEFLSNEDVAKIVAPFYNAGQAEQAANQVVRESANQWKVKEEVIDDITCVIVFLDTKLIERSLKYRQAQIDTLISQSKETEQEQSIFVQPLNKHFLDYNLAASYEGGVKK
jgi:serine/threonine protein phosphatase PrpC